MHSEGKYAEELAVKFPGTKLGWMDRVLYRARSCRKTRYLSSDEW